MKTWSLSEGELSLFKDKEGSSVTAVKKRPGWSWSRFYLILKPDVQFWVLAFLQHNSGNVVFCRLPEFYVKASWGKLASEGNHLNYFNNYYYYCLEVF